MVKKRWQADFTAEDRKLIIEWIDANLSPWDSWGQPLADLAWRVGKAPAPVFNFQTTDFQGKTVVLTAKLNRDLTTREAKKAFRTIGLPFADQYIEALRDFGARHRPAMSEDGVFANMWMNLSVAGAAVHLPEILTADEESAQRWKKYLKAERKTWRDVRIPTWTAAMIGEEILRTLARDLKIPTKNAEALRGRFRRYTEQYLS